MPEPEADAQIKSLAQAAVAEVERERGDSGKVERDRLESAMERGRAMARARHPEAS